MVRHMAASTDAPLHDIVRMASLTPAERAGISAVSGSLAAGKRADVLVLSRDLFIERVFLAGQEYTL
jgi:N-acetylglucosamine-6-phosphate deacetylase